MSRTILPPLQAARGSASPRVLLCPAVPDNECDGVPGPGRSARRSGRLIAHTNTVGGHFRPAVAPFSWARSKFTNRSSFTDGSEPASKLNLKLPEGQPLGVGDRAVVLVVWWWLSGGFVGPGRVEGPQLCSRHSDSDPSPRQPAAGVTGPNQCSGMNHDGPTTITQPPWTHLGWLWTT